MTTSPAALQPPGSLSVTTGDNQLTLRWTASISADAVAYRIYRRNPDGTWPAQPMEGSTHTEYVDLEVRNGIAYAYRVCAVDAHGNMSLAQEATATPVGSAVSGKTFPLKTLVLACVLAAVVVGAGAYLFGESQGKASGQSSGEKSGYQAGVTAGSDQVAAQYAKGASGYKNIYDEGYQAGKAAGTKSGVKAGKASGEAAGKKIGYEQGETAGKSAGVVTGEKEAYALALGNYSSWVPSAPYMVSLEKTTSSSVPFGVTARHPVEPGYNYYLCVTGSNGVCRSTRSTK